MKVLVISHTYIASINREKWSVLAEQHKDVELKIVFPNVWRDVLFTLKAQDCSKYESSNCKFIPLKAFKTGNETLYGYYPKGLIQVLRSFKPDLIHIEQGESAFSFLQTIFLAKIFSSKSKFIFFTWLNWRPRRSLRYKLFCKVVESFNRFFSSGAIVGNEDAKHILLEKKFLKPIKVLPQLGVNQKFFVSAKRSSKNKFYLGYVGRITLEKGVLLLVDAFEQLSDKYLEWNLLFVGNGDDHKNLISYVLSRNLERRVEFRVAVGHDKVVSVLQKLDILVLPSYDTLVWKEQFGHILIEAMSCKIPVIGSTGGEIANVIKDAGLIFEQKNKEQLASCMQALMEDKQLRLALAEKGYKRVMNHFSHEAIAHKTYDFWRDFTYY